MRHKLSLLAGVIAMTSSVQALAAGTLAGQSISNTATADYDIGGGPQTIASNAVVMRVDELLDVTVVSNDPGPVLVRPGSTDRVTSFTFTNTGNGPEAFTLSTNAAVGGDNFDPQSVRIVLDNGNGVYEPGIDVAYIPGTNDPLLAPDASRVVFVVSNIPAATSDGQRGLVELIATAKTGTGAPGTTFAGLGEAGVNAVVGSSTATDTASGTYQIAASTVALNKSAVVTDPFGGSSPVPGATIAYTITASVTGSVPVNSLTIRDAIPAGTVYVPGSLLIGTTTLTDIATDTDGGQYDGSGIAVTMASVPAGDTRTVTFRVTIQ